MLDFNWSSSFLFEINENRILSWFNLVCESEGKNLAEVAVVFCNDEELLKVNNQFLDHDFYTDIITFDYCEEDSIIGDLFISTDRVKDNAENLSVSILFELERVLVHGLLHLCGYHDKTKEESIEMTTKENFYLDKLKCFT